MLDRVQIQQNLDSTAGREWRGRRGFQHGRKWGRMYGCDLAILRKALAQRDHTTEGVIQDFVRKYSGMVNEVRTSSWYLLGVTSPRFCVWVPHVDRFDLLVRGKSLIEGNPLLAAIARDNERFRTSEWGAPGILPCLHDGSELHFLHLSVEEPKSGKVCYYRSLSNLIADRQTRTTIEKYLGEFSDVDSAEAARIGRRLRAEFGTVKFVENDDPAGWVRVYRDGPSSCMSSGKVYDQALTVYCYPGNGLRLAYLEDEDGNVNARCIVRDGEVQGYLRVYPDPCGDSQGQALLDQLAALGYADRINLDGVKVRAINAGGSSYYMPYIDVGSGGEQYAQLCDGYFLLGEGDCECDNTDGTTSEDEVAHCDHCDDRTPVDELTETYSHGHVCEHCLGNHYTYAVVEGVAYSDHIRSAEWAWVRDGDTSTYLCSDGEEIKVTDDWAADNAYWCEEHDAYVEATAPTYTGFRTASEIATWYLATCEDYVRVAGDSSDYSYTERNEVEELGYHCSDSDVADFTPTIAMFEGDDLAYDYYTDEFDEALERFLVRRQQFMDVSHDDVLHLLASPEVFVERVM